MFQPKFRVLLVVALVGTLSVGANAVVKRAEVDDALKALNNVDCKDTKPLRKALGLFGEVCGLLQGKNIEDQRINCDKQVEQISALSRKCDAKKLREVASKLTGIVRLPVVDRLLKD